VIIKIINLKTFILSLYKLTQEIEYINTKLEMRKFLKIKTGFLQNNCLWCSKWKNSIAKTRKQKNKAVN